MRPTRFQNYRKTILTLSQSGPKTISKWSQVDTKTIPKWYQAHPKTMPNWYQNDPKMISTWSFNLGCQGQKRQENACGLFLKTLLSLIVSWPDTRLLLLTLFSRVAAPPVHITHHALEITHHPIQITHHSAQQISHHSVQITHHSVNSINRGTHLNKNDAKLDQTVTLLGSQQYNNWVSFLFCFALEGPGCPIWAPSP